MFSLESNEGILYLPEILSYLDPASLVFLDKELFTDVTAGERKEADLVVKAQFTRGEVCRDYRDFQAV